MIEEDGETIHLIKKPAEAAGGAPTGSSQNESASNVGAS
jgi:hypothetical protein